MPQVVINKAEWEGFLGDILDSKYLLTELISTGKGRATFTAHETPSQPVMLVITDAELSDPEMLRRRYLEATFLSHENLLRIAQLGQANSHGRNLIYTVLEPAEMNLERAASGRRFTPEELRELVLQVSRGLHYLHSENLVYCALAPATIWQIGDLWKLGDYSQLRLPGVVDPRETRALLTRDPSIPPEAFEGIVTPPWDVWMLGWVLGKMPDRDRSLDPIVAGCMKPNPGDRWTLDQIIESVQQRPAPAETPLAVPPLSSPSEHEVPPPAALHRAPASPMRQKHSFRAFAGFLFAVLILCCAAVGILYFQTRNPALSSPRVAAQPDRKPIRAVPPTAGAADREVPRQPLDTTAISRDVAPQDIRALLDRWVNSIRDRNVDQQAACYAPTVNQFFGWHNVSSTRIRREKQRQFSQIGPVREFRISNVDFNETGPGKAVVTFDKTWDFGQTSRFAGSERSQLTLTNIDGQWLITGERELKVYWVKRHRTESAG